MACILRGWSPRTKRVNKERRKGVHGCQVGPARPAEREMKPAGIRGTSVKIGLICDANRYNTRPKKWAPWGEGVWFLDNIGKETGFGRASRPAGHAEGADVAARGACRMAAREAAPFEYRIRTSPRARQVSLKLSPREGLTVVVPRNFDLRRVPGIVERKKPWIEMNLRRFADLAAAGEAPAVALPEGLDLPALDESWRVEYQPTRTNYVGVLADEPGRITVYGAVEDHDACREALKRWLHRRTREELVPWLERLARERGFSFCEAIVRGQKTRWASCSSRGTISLSFKLLFLERDCVRCVLLHELCHTKVMNHSPRFWALLAGFVPEYKGIRMRMRLAWKRVPAWVEALPGENQNP